MQLQNVFDRIEQYKEASIEAIKELVRVPTTAANNQGNECADIIIDMIIKEIGFETQKIDTAGFPIVYAETKVDADTTLVFYNHYDIQPAEPLDKWISPPFEPEVREGKLYGRGVQDDKGNIIARIFAIKAYQSVFGKSPLNIKFIIEGQEEVGSPTLPEFINNYPDLIQGDFCIWESGHRNANRQQQVWLGVKGILYLTLELSSAKRDIHSSWGGVVQNPAWELVWLLQSLKDKDQTILIDGFYDTVKAPTDEEIKHLETIPFDEETYAKNFGITHFLKTGLELKKAQYFLPTLTIDGLESGYQGPGSKTIIPSTAKAKLDFRLVPNQDPQDVLEKFKKHLDLHQFHNVRITSSRGYPAARTPLSSKYLNIICETGTKIYEQPLIVHPTKPGSGPMYLFSNKMDCFSFACGNANSYVHAPNENIIIEDLILNMKHFAAIFHTFEKNRV